VWTAPVLENAIAAPTEAKERFYDAVPSVAQAKRKEKKILPVVGAHDVAIR
jgi:hypothetical protein